jgi:hypothetical protein
VPKVIPIAPEPDPGIAILDSGNIDAEIDDSFFRDEGQYDADVPVDVEDGMVAEADAARALLPPGLEASQTGPGDAHHRPLGLESEDETTSELTDFTPYLGQLAPSTLRILEEEFHARFIYLIQPKVKNTAAGTSGGMISQP